MRNKKRAPLARDVWQRGAKPAKADPKGFFEGLKKLAEKHGATNVCSRNSPFDLPVVIFGGEKPGKQMVYEFNLYDQGRADKYATTVHATKVARSKALIVK